MMVFVQLMELLLLPCFLLMRCVEELTGEGRWYRQQRRRMECDRQPLPDAAFLRVVAAEPGEVSLWLAVRKAVANTIGLPEEAVHPHDQLADLWRMQWLGPDLLSLIFQLERLLEVKISRAAIAPHIGKVYYGQAGEFHEFARGMVRGLSSLARAARQEYPDTNR